MKTKQNKIGTYLAVTAGVGCAASVADAAVTFYGPGAINPSSSPATPTGNNIGNDRFTYYTTTRFSSFSAGDVLGISNGTFNLFSAAPTIFANRFIDDYLPMHYGTQNSDQNYINISFDPSGVYDGVYEAVGQFHFNSGTGGYLVALAVNEDGSALSIIDGKALIDAAAVPEPSSLALLALGSAGLIARRRRKAA